MEQRTPLSHCAQCGTETHDDPAEPVTKREPCPNCGGTGRTWTVPIASPAKGDVLLAGGRVDVTVTPPTVAIRASVPAPSVRVTNRAMRRAEELAAATAVRQVHWHDPGEDGVMLCEVRDAEGNVIAAEVGTDLEDMILNLADALLPPANPRA